MTGGLEACNGRGGGGGIAEEAATFTIGATVVAPLLVAFAEDAQG
jgi:hypothetical protein